MNDGFALHVHCYLVYKPMWHWAKPTMYLDTKPYHPKWTQKCKFLLHKTTTNV